ncbi:MAG: peptidoglycan-binding protein [Nocardioides sp.]|nr:peptidoglycan-binding protein [Nocardioides sp.]
MVALGATGVVGADLVGVVEPRSWLPSAMTSAQAQGGETASSDDSDDPTTAPPPEPTGPPALLAAGDTGMTVRSLQVRLRATAWLDVPPTGTYDRRTTRAVRGFQRKRELPVTGELDRRTWRRLLAMTEDPTRAEMLHRPGPALLSSGDAGSQVREVEARLRQIAWFFGDVGDSFDAQTVEAVRGFQAKRRIPVTGQVDRRTLDLLEGMTTEPTADDLANVVPAPSDGTPLDPRCTTGAVLCIDKTSNSLRWVVDGVVRKDLDVRFGSAELPTREGAFSVFHKSRDHVSSLYDTPMPMAMFFSGGQAVHYSPDFAANGYSGASHGCVNVRDYGEIAALFDQVPLGTPVIVYRS